MSKYSRVTIRPLQERDAYTSVIWRNDPEVFKYTGNTYKHIITIESELNWIRNVIRNNKDGIEYRCAIEVNDIYIGNIYLTDISEGGANYHIFIGDRRYWGKGVAKRASLLILNYAFNELMLLSVSLKVHKDNLSAVNLYEKLGFEKTGYNDNWISMIINKDTYKC